MAGTESFGAGNDPSTIDPHSGLDPIADVGDACPGGEDPRLLMYHLEARPR